MILDMFCCTQKTYCSSAKRPQEDYGESRAAHPMLITWTSHIAKAIKDMLEKDVKLHPVNNAERRGQSSVVLFCKSFSIS